MYERSESQTRALRDWFNSHGGFLDDGVEISFSEPEGVHLRASRDLNLAGGEKCRTIIRCPSTLSLSYLNVTGDDTVNFPRRGNVGKLLRGYLPDDALACFLLLEQKHIGKSSFWASYISLLPGEDDLTTPLYFSAVDREWLVGTNMLEALPCRERSWRDEHKRGTDRLDELQEDTTIYTW